MKTQPRATAKSKSSRRTAAPRPKRQTSSIWDRGVGGGRSGRKKSLNWAAGAFSGSSWANSWAAGLVSLGLLGACDHMPDFKAYTPYEPQTVREPRVQPIAVAHSVPFGAGSVTLDAATGQNIDAFLARQRVDRVDALEVAIPAGGGEIARSRAERILAYLKLKRLHAGLVIDDDPKMPGDTVRLVVNRYQVALPGCPDWSGRGGITWDNQPSSNWGCANAVNLGLMVANPADLIGVRDAGPGDGEAQVLGIQRYRKGETTPLLGAETSEPPAAGTGAPQAGGGEGGSQ